MDEKIIRLACYTKNGRRVLGERWQDEFAKIDPQYRAVRGDRGTMKMAPVKKRDGVAHAGSSVWDRDTGGYGGNS